MKAKLLSKTLWLEICLIGLVIIFFSFSAILTYDSGHYLSYVSIFEGNAPTSSWDIVRGPVFPIIIHLSNLLFGKNNTGLLICTFLFYISFILICSIITKKITKNYKHRKLINTLIILYLALNPLILGYYHVLLTEFVAITITMLNVLLAFKWLFIKQNNKKSLLLYSIYFIFITSFCWHLKQPYIIIAIIPTIIASIISIINNHQKNNILYRLGTILLSILFLFLSILSWNAILDIMHVDKNTGRDSSSSLSKQLIVTYSISNENEGISTFINETLHNPGKIIGKYINNYCSLASLCKVASENSVDYVSTNELSPFDTYENSSIGYATFERTNNIFQMSDEMLNRASYYSINMNPGVLKPVMKALMRPTNVIFELAILLCFPFTIFLLILRIKNKGKKHQQLFYLSFILLSTASCHIIFSAVALVIDRYAIEAFTPTILGIIGTLTYAKLLFTKKTTIKKARQ